MGRRLPDADLAPLRQAADRAALDYDDFDAWLRDLGYSWEGVERGDYGLTLEHALLMFVMADPVRWGEAFLIEPDTGEPWRFFDYQRDSVRAWLQPVVHQDGAEVGKTREITVLILWGQCTAMGLTQQRPWMLVGAPQQTHLDEIILAVEEQMGAQEAGGAKGGLLSPFWLKPKRTPHVMHRFLTVPTKGEAPGIGRVYYRPAGHDGEAFRGVHVNAMAFMDEAAKLKRAVQFSEFWRAMKPGCISRVYSVPDGDRQTEFFKLTQNAVENRPPNQAGMRLFRWPKTIMPAPFWSATRDRQFVELYGSRQAPGYVRNVLGEWGDAENPVFSWDLLLPNVAELPDFRILRLHADRARNELAVRVQRVSLSVNHGRKIGQAHDLVDTAVDLGPLLSRDDSERRQAMQALVTDHLQPITMLVGWIGADLGETNDPTEIIVSSQMGNRWRDELRVSVKGLPYLAQCELIHALDTLTGQKAGWGVDLGNAGTVVVSNLQNMELFDDARFDERMIGFQFSNAVDCIGEDGEPLRDPRDDDGEKIVRAPAKHWATQCIVKRLQVQGYQLAYDADMLDHYTSHTVREGAKWPIYGKTNDHTIDARRVQMLRCLYAETAGAVDVFSTGAIARSKAA